MFQFLGRHYRPKKADTGVILPPSPSVNPLNQGPILYAQYTRVAFITGGGTTLVGVNASRKGYYIRPNTTLGGLYIVGTDPLTVLPPTSMIPFITGNATQFIIYLTKDMVGNLVTYEVKQTANIAGGFADVWELF